MLTVMIVDDSSLLRKRIRERIEHMSGVNVVGEAEDAPQAIHEFGRLLPDVVVLDIQMPGGSGIDVLQTIKQVRPETTVLMLTNFPLPQFRVKCAQAGAEFFLDKSGEFEKVATVLQSLARGDGGDSNAKIL